jgi:hypothetical protein
VSEDSYAELITPQGVLDQWQVAVYNTVTALAPLFLAISLLCYFRAAPASSEVTQRLYGAIGVVYLVVFSLAVITTVTLGLPAILFGRLLESICYGKRITWEVVLLSVMPVLTAFFYYIYHERQLWAFKLLPAIVNFVK